MVLLLNLLLPTIILFICWIGTKNFKRAVGDQAKIFSAVKTIFAILLVVFVYSTIQPSYLPKGAAPAMSKVPIEQREVVLQDRLLKPMAEEDRQKRVDEILTVRDEVKQVLEQNKKVD